MPENVGKIKWDQIGEHLYETGVDHGLLSIVDDTGKYGVPIAWNGLTNVSENPSGADANAQYADNIKYLNLIAAEDFGLTIEAYTYPKEFGACDGTAEIAPGVTIGQQSRRTFGFHYRTRIGNDVMNDNYGYKLHFAYGCVAAPSEKGYGTVSDSPEPISFSWEVNTTPVPVEGFKPTAILTIDSTIADKEKLQALEELIYGKDPTTDGGEDGVAPHFPLPDEIMTLLTAG